MTDPLPPAADRMPMLPGNVVLPISELQRIATTAAMDAARMVREQSVTRDDVEEIAEKVIDRVIERLFDAPLDDHKAVGEIRKDLGFMRSCREMRDSALKQGVIVVVGAAVLGIMSAIWFKLSGGVK